MSEALVNADSDPKTNFLVDPLLLYICIFFTGTIVLWWSLDHTYPQWDAANHALAAAQYASLLKHMHLTSGSWYQQFFSVDYQYPLCVNVLNGLFKVVFGVSRLSEIVAYAFYQNILLIGVYQLSEIIFKNRITAAFSAILINLLPLVSSLSHVQLLDYPMLAFNAMALYGMAKWLAMPGRQNCFFMAVTVALATNCKQISPFYLIVPCLFLLVKFFVQRHYQRVLELVITGTTTAALMALWVVPNFTRLRAAQKISTAECLQDGSYWSVCLQHTLSYLTGLPQILSPLLLLLLAVSLMYIVIKKRWQTELWLPLTANFGGAILMCLVAASRPELRYVVPVTISTSLISAHFLSLLWRENRPSRIVVCIILLIAFLQFLIFNYSPSPIPVSQTLSQAVKKFVQGPLAAGAVEPPTNPLPAGDLWGQEWIIDTVKGTGAVRLNVMPSIAEISVHTLELVALYKKAPLEISTFRRFTLNGDVVEYNQAAIDHYNWYLTKDGNQSGFKFADKASEETYNRIQNYVETGAFRLIERRRVADGSNLSLYQRQ